MFRSEEETLEFIKENDIQFLRLAFCDAYGTQKNISVQPSELPRAFSSGVLIDADAFGDAGKLAASDLFLVPDYRTLTVLPWRPAQGGVARFFCHIKRPDGTPYPLDGREILRRAEEKLRERHVNCIFGTECEFYLFKNDERGVPTEEPLDGGGYMDIAPLDKGENIRREICLALEEMGIAPQTSRHERGPGQNEITFKCAAPLHAADDVTTYKSVVEALSAISGLTARFDPLPLPDRPGNGLHINIRVEGEDGRDDTLRASFLAGILARIREITVFLNPTPRSYSRLGARRAPGYVAWSTENSGRLIHSPLYEQELGLIKLRSPDPKANPYLAFALLIYAGLDGVERGLMPPAPFSEEKLIADPEYLRGFEALPKTMEEAASLAAGSEFVRGVLPREIVDIYTAPATGR